MLYRLAGSPAVSGSTPFTDVKANSYYADALVWAYQNKLAAGNTATTFAPNKTATREEMVSFFARFAKLSGQTVEAKGDLGGGERPDPRRIRRQAQPQNHLYPRGCGTGAHGVLPEISEIVLRNAIG